MLLKIFLGAITRIPRALVVGLIWTVHWKAENITKGE